MRQSLTFSRVQPSEPARFGLRLVARYAAIALVTAGAFASSAFAQGYGGYRDDPYYRGGHDRSYRDSYRDEYAGGNVVQRARADLENGASTSFYAPRQREHFDHALRELNKFEGKWSRGQFDRHALDEAIGEMAHLARAGELNPRLRERMARDTGDLRAFRAHGRDDSYYPR